METGGALSVARFSYEGLNERRAINDDASARYGVRRRLSLVFYWQAPTGESNRVAACCFSAAALSTLFSQSVGAARRDGPQPIPHDQIRLARTISCHRQTGRFSGSGR